MTMRGCISKRKNGTYAYTIEMGKHPQTGRRKQRLKAGFATRKDAEQALALALADLGRGSYIEETKQTVQEYFTGFLALKRPNLRPGTIRTYKWLINFHIIPYIGHIQLAKLTPHHLLTMYDDLMQVKHLAAHTVNHIHRVLHDGMATAVRHEVLSRNVAALVRPPKIPKTKPQLWTGEQLVKFLDEIKDDKFYIIILLAATCGLRRGEALALRWKDVNFKDGTISVAQSYVMGEKGHDFQEPKTRSSIRTIAVPKLTMEALKRQRVIQAKEKFYMGEKYTDSGLVSQTRRGLPINPCFFVPRWHKLIEKHGLTRIRYHDLRHMHASLLLKQNVHPKVVSERLGHSSVGITLDRYSHTYGVDYGAAEEMDALLSIKTMKVP